MNKTYEEIVISEIYRELWKMKEGRVCLILKKSRDWRQSFKRE